MALAGGDATPVRVWPRVAALGARARECVLIVETAGWLGSPGGGGARRGGCGLPRRVRRGEASRGGDRRAGPGQRPGLSARRALTGQEGHLAAGSAPLSGARRARGAGATHVQRMTAHAFAYGGGRSFAAGGASSHASPRLARSGPPRRRRATTIGERHSLRGVRPPGLRARPRARDHGPVAGGDRRLP